MSGFQFESRRPERPRSTAPLVNAPSQVAFYFIAHPNRWDLFDGELLPVLGKLRLQPGIEGVRQNGDHMIAKAAKERRGWEVIPWNVVTCTARGQQYPEYLHYFDGSKGRIYIEIWCTPIQVRGGTPSWKTDIEGYKQFLRDLVAAGAVPDPDPALLDNLEARLQSSIDRMVPRADRSPAIQRQVDRCQKQLEIISAMKNGEAVEIPAPTPAPKKAAPRARRGRAKKNV